MNSIDRKKISVIAKYAIDSFTEGDWLTLGQITGKIKGRNRVSSNIPTFMLLLNTWLDH